MFQITYDKIISLIKEGSGLSDAEIEQKIQDKLNELSGLISKDGAAHIVANQLGIKLFDQSGGRLEIKNVLSGMRNVEIVGKVMGVYETREFSTEKSSGKVGSFLIGDETGVVRVTCWHAQTDLLKTLVVGDVVRIKGAYARDNNNRVEIHLNDKSGFERNPEGVSVSIPDNLVKDSDNLRKKISELGDAESNIELLAAVVQVFNPTFFEVCPECSKRLKRREDRFFCEAHNFVNPEFSFVMNCVLDDGTGTIRAVFFRDQMLKLLQRSHEEMLHYKEIPEKIDTLKSELIGQLIKVGGRTSKNTMFDRLEFNVRTVDPKPNPEEELKNLVK